MASLIKSWRIQYKRKVRNISKIVDMVTKNVLIILIFLSLLSCVLSQYPFCDHSTNVIAGHTSYIYGPNFPADYPKGMNCRWTVRCPTGHNCRLDCDINMPSTAECSGDRLLISTTGDKQLVEADSYCGNRSFSVLSSGQMLTMALQTTFESGDGNFLCKVEAEESPSSVTYAKAAPCKCGIRKTSRIVGGQDVKPNEFPMMAGLVERGTSYFMCGAVIISEYNVLSAAHCVQRKYYDNIAVVVGEHDISTGSDTPYTKAYRLSRIVIHPRYNKNTFDFDVAILKTSDRIIFSEYVGPVCLPFKFRRYSFAGEKLTVLGWGTLFIGGPTPNVLQKVVVDVISQASCRTVVPGVTPRQMCTYTPGKDSCQYDSGGPLLYTYSNGLLYHAGIVSSGSLCASPGEPAVNTRVTEILDWVVRTAPANYCRI